jgi:hypothetical protein
MSTASYVEPFLDRNGNRARAWSFEECEGVEKPVDEPFLVVELLSRR